ADRVVLVEAGRTVGEHRLADLPRGAASTWRVRALATAPLLAALDARAVAYSDPGPGGVEVRLGGDEEAAELLAGLVRDGVPVVSLAPASSALESAYLTMTQERR
ncbi:ABC transporter ATP-binding protein, partial [Motilibacter sp. E257]